jgi:hypothetical protein
MKLEGPSPYRNLLKGKKFRITELQRTSIYVHVVGVTLYCVIFKKKETKKKRKKMRKLSLGLIMSNFGSIDYTAVRYCPLLSAKLGPILY